MKLMHDPNPLLNIVTCVCVSKIINMKKNKQKENRNGEKMQTGTRIP